jgi:hypothetical protein
MTHAKAGIPVSIVKRHLAAHEERLDQDGRLQKRGDHDASQHRLRLDQFRLPHAGYHGPAIAGTPPQIVIARPGTGADCASGTI